MTDQPTSPAAPRASGDDLPSALAPAARAGNPIAIAAIVGVTALGGVGGLSGLFSLGPKVDAAAIQLTKIADGQAEVRERLLSVEQKLSASTDRSSDHEQRLRACEKELSELRSIVGRAK